MTRRDLLLHLLREAGERGVNTAELLTAGVGSRYGARLLELRDAGYVIESHRERQSSYRYTLLSEPDSERGSSNSRLDSHIEAKRAVSPSPAAAPLSAEAEGLFDVPVKAKTTAHWKSEAA